MSTQKHPVLLAKWIKALLVCIVSSQNLQSAQMSTISVHSPRVLNDCIIELEKLLDTTITFEEAPYTHSSDVRSLYPDGPIIPRDKRFHFVYPVEEDPHRVVLALLNQYNSTTHAGFYAVTNLNAKNRILHVFPEQTKHTDGSLGSFESLNIRRVSTAIDVGTTINEALQAICDALTTREEKVTLAQFFPSGGPYLSPRRFQDESAIKCLHSVLDEFANMPNGFAVSWSLRREPTTPGKQGLAVLSLRRVPQHVESGNHNCVAIESERPLADALQILEGFAPARFLYEDIEFKCLCDVMVDKLGRPQSPRGGRLSFSFGPGEVAAERVRKCVDAYNGGDNAGTYGFRQEDGVFSIFPVSGKNLHGDRTNASQVLTNRVDVPQGELNGAEIAGWICWGLEQTSKRKVVKGVSDESFMTNSGLSDATRGGTAASVLSNIKDAAGQRKSWYLFYFPSNGVYILK